ncbi:MAG: adenine nucleotide alpha hydrolase [Actinomycetia bacterium]|nr:adenine nucleotide alpha hydrolase [Actinomycetes bacterium]
MTPLARLQAHLRELGPTAVAVSGGIDSLTLAHVAHRAAPGSQVFHAVSAAVPEAATSRVRDQAGRWGWDLHEINAGEFDDPAYVANPVDRCFHCKQNLYGSIGAHTALPIASGTNTDDLDDYRPGLVAASAARVIHPFVEAGIDKPTIRAIAPQIGLGDLADLPAAPCLASRVETGITVDPGALAAIDAVEVTLRDELRADTVRCRLRGDRISIELDHETLGGLDGSELARLEQMVTAHWLAAGVTRPVRFEPYRRGSAFLRVVSS